MEYQKIIQKTIPPKTRTKYCVEINDDSRRS